MLKAFFPALELGPTFDPWEKDLVSVFEVIRHER